jgi:hypothetical protein
MPFELRSPAHLALLGLLVPLVLLYVLKIRREQRRVPSVWLWRSAERDLLAKQPFRRFFPYFSLILEALALASLALAFARPLRRGGQLDSLHLAIVIDTSASMGTVGPDGRTRIELAREAARALSRQLAPGADALVIEAGREPRVVSPLERDPKRIEAALDRVKLAEVEGDLGRALGLASDHLRSHPGTSRIVVVTDGALAHPEAFAVASLPTDVVRVGAPADNVGVVRADVARSSEASGRDRVQVFALVKNFGKTPRSTFVTLLPQSSTTPLASRRLELAAGEEAPVVLSFESSASDQGMGLVIDLAPEDALRADDRAYVRVPAGQHLPVVLSPKTASPWIARALASDPGIELLGAELTALGADVPYDAFVVVEGACPDRIPGSDFLLVNPKAGSCHGVTVGAPIERPTITSWTDGDPRLRFTSFEGVLIQRASSLVPDGPRASLVRAREGTLIADISGAGRTGTLVGFDVGESNWPLRASFVLFVRNLLELARNHRAGVAAGPARTGEPLALRVPFDVSEVELQGPDGTRMTIPARAGVAATPGPDRAGLYFVSWKGQRPGSTLVPVNLTSALESDLRERELPLPKGRPVVARKAADLRDSVTDWSWLLAAIALLAFVLDLYWLTRSPRHSLLSKGAPPAPVRGAAGTS